MSLVETLARTHYETGADGLQIAGVSIVSVARQFGTPFYAYAPDIFRKKMASLRGTLPFAELYYSMKANPNPSVVKTFVDAGAGIEIASGGELSIALRCGCDPARILFAGPGKRESELKAAMNAGIGEFHVESFMEIERIDTLSRLAGARSPVSIRVNAGEAARNGAMVMSGESSPFGIDEERLFEAIEKVAGSPHLAFTGLHFYAGTQILDADAFAGTYSYCLDLAKDVCRGTGLRLATIDFGGGFGIPYFEHDCELDLDSLSDSLASVFRDARASHGLEHTRFIIEPGRYLVADGGLYAARIIDIKTSRGTAFIILDGGMHHNIAPTGHFGQIIKRNFPIAIANRIQEAPVMEYHIVGPLCTPLDTMGRNVMLPRAEIGDVVVFFQAGAYALTASPVRFLSHPEPVELMVEDNHVRVARFPVEAGIHESDPDTSVLANQLNVSNVSPIPTA